MAEQRRGLVVAALMLTTGLAAIDATIVATAVPQIVHDLGGFTKFPWLFSLYLLTQAVLVPIYGRLADVFGRKPILLLGIGVFLVASVLCGAAWSMVSLIAFRGLQGVGAGAIIPMTTTIVGDLYEPADRGRIQGYISSVWGVSAIVGPTLGGVFAQYLSWRGIFFVNIPIGAGALWMLQRHLREHVVRRSHRIDVAGAAVLTLALSALILALLEGGVSWSWTSAQSIVLFAVACVLLVAFLPIERAAAEPILPLWVFRPRILVSTTLAGFVIGAILIGLTSYVPTFAQRVVGVGAVVAGLAMGAMTVGWPIAATLSPKVYLRIDYRRTAMLGGAFAIAGCLLFALFVHADSGIWRVAVASFVTGIGLGFSSVSTVVSAQSVVGWERRGVVTGTNMFIRSLGSAVGVAVFGSIVNSELHGHASLYHAVHVVFWALVVVAVLGFAAELTMPKRVVPLVFHEEGAGYARGALASTPAPPATSRARS
jgi:EmrB/QacA subfamily drug resistance transporter